MMNFPFGTNGKFIILGVPILKHIRVCEIGLWIILLAVTLKACTCCTFA